MRSVFVVMLSASVLLSCSQTVMVPAAPPVAEVSMTPVHRSADGMVVAHAHLLGWGAGPASLPPGAQAIVLEGDPTKAGLFTIRIKLPNNYRIPPHFHSAWEHITVISGIFHLGMGDTFDPSKFNELRAGSFAAMPTGMRHYVHTVGETIVQLHGMGPWTVTYVNRADDPRNR
jgi:quercetin dioxygenase-like cupin family protein